MDVNASGQLVTELKNLKYALDQSAIVAVTDKSGKILHVNDMFCKISQYSREELVGKTHRLINSHYHPKSFFKEMWKTISSGEVWKGEIKNRAKDGSEYWVDTSIVPLRNEKDEISQFIAIRFEITDRKQGEVKLKKYSEELERSNEELANFASVAAHDLQEPLRKIQTFADRIVQKDATRLSGQGKDYLDRMCKAARRMQLLISDLLTYSRVSSRFQPNEKVSLTKIIEQVLEDLELKVENLAAKVNVAPLPSVEADAVQMRQVFQNLIGNALKFHRDGVKPRVEIGVKQSGDESLLNSNQTVSEGLVQIFVKDNGIGFDEKYLDRIFTIFQRLHGRSEYEGTGVGLAVCRKIVDRHGGRLSAKSRPGMGSTFIVELPILYQAQVGVSNEAK